MSTTKYRAFLKVVELQSLTKAGKALGYSQPGISHMIDSLEDMVGFPLFIRRKDQVLLTTEGERVLPYFREIVKNEDALQQMSQSVSGLLSGTLRIGAFNSMLIQLLPKVIAEFSRTYSGIEIRIEEGNISSLRQALSRGDIDLAFMSNDPPKGFEFRHLFDDPIGVLMNVKHPFAERKKITIDMLNGCDFIMPQDGWHECIPIIQKKKAFTPNIRYHVGSESATIALVSEQLGLSTLAKLQIHHLPDNVVFREFEEAVARDMGMCTRSFSHMAPALKEFVNATSAIMPAQTIS